ncbi:hypothetical protein EDC01DRAFT_526038 [Geopyxis carbonaria]|nr:hypothetical protein EDC01DRAFT_526038 [Geopyxis carbonaria]
MLQKELESLTSRATGLSEELQETMDLLTSPYYRTLPDAEKVLLHDEFEHLEDSLPEIGLQLSTSLQKSTLEIAKIAYPNENPRTIETKIDTLPADTAHRFNNLQKSRVNLTQKQMALTTLCCEILDEYQSINTRLLALLSQKSTTIANALTTKTEHLALVAEGMYLKLSMLKHEALEAIYDPEAVNALENYQIHLKDTSTRLIARERVVKEDLEKYKNAGSDMKGLVERYSHIMRSIDTVTKDIKRLGGKV